MVHDTVPLELVGAGAGVQVCAVDPLPRVKVSVRPTTGVAPESEVSVAETVRFPELNAAYGVPLKPSSVSSKVTLKGADPLDPVSWSGMLGPASPAKLP